MTEPGLSILGDLKPGFPSGAEGAAGPGLARWLHVAPDGRVTAFSGKVEYGQNIRTGLAVEIADELRVPLASVDVILGDTDRVPFDMGTFGSQSTARVGLRLRHAAATAREVLLELAARRLDLPVEDILATNGAVVSKADPTHAVTYAELVADESIEHELNPEAPLTNSSEFTIMGSDVLRVDAHDRVTGLAVFSQDVTRRGMLFARILRAPSFGAELVKVDVSPAEGMPGVFKVVQEDGLIAVLGEDDESAGAAIAAVRAEWNARRTGSSIDIPTMLLETKQDPIVIQETGDVEGAFRRADHVLEETYYVPHITPIPMEPRAAVAEWDGDRLTVWAGTQRPFGLRGELAGMFHIPTENVRVIATEIGGGFGTKSWFPNGAEAAKLARIAGRPVRVAYTREEDLTEGNCRPAALITVKSGFQADGTITAWQFQAIHAGPLVNIAQREANTPYNIPNLDVSVCCADTFVRVGSYRSLGAAANNFARESHMDEIAAALSIDPLDLRLRNLTSPRHRHVLVEAADRFGWSGAASPSQRGVGIALGEDVSSYVASCVELSVNDNRIRVQRAVTAIDCGLVVNPEGVRNQVEGSTMMGLGGALYEAIEIGNGVIQNANLSRYEVPRIADTPDIEVVLAGDPAMPSTGAGEPGMVTVAPAIANAVFDSTGQRIRELPLQRQLR